MNNMLIITGSDGETAKGLINFFASKYKHIIGISRHQKTHYNQESVKTVKADMLSYVDVKNVTSSIIDKYGNVDGWINCVGGFNMGKTIEEEEDWTSMHSINFTTCLNGCRAIIPYLKRQGDGAIINFGSKAALDGFSSAGPYLISKSSVHTLTKLISIELSTSNIRCNAILPGIIDTEANRTAMPNEDFSIWESPKDIAIKINDIIHSDVSGELVTL